MVSINKNIKRKNTSSKKCSHKGIDDIRTILSLQHDLIVEDNLNDIEYLLYHGIQLSMLRFYFGFIFISVILGFWFLSIFLTIGFAVTCYRTVNSLDKYKKYKPLK